ncbi:acyl-[acyl-carrier-protein]--UDP-N-acetylglucosamine O-acyltransferase, partial [Escherichia coli]|nr:acyl-[acyl-carrier-protein]--UDP-N-acetylglucosamine O-acyltransferase [Escherichia coli]
MSTFIHKTALVSPDASIGEDCYIGPFSVIGQNVKLGNRVRVDSHAVIDGRTTIGDDSHLFPFVSIGLAPQDLKYGGEDTETVIGS